MMSIKMKQGTAIASAAPPIYADDNTQTKKVLTEFFSLNTSASKKQKAIKPQRYIAEEVIQKKVSPAPVVKMKNEISNETTNLECPGRSASAISPGDLFALFLIIKFSEKTEKR